MRMRIPAIAEVRAWAETHVMNEPIGVSNESDCCPIHNYFDEVQDIYVAVNTWTISANDVVIDIIDTWLSSAINLIDEIDNKQAVTVLTVTFLNILDIIQKEWPNS